MSKTIEVQIDKSLALIKGYKKNLEELSKRGITSASLDSMEEDLKALKEANDECDAIRKQLAEKVKKMNGILLRVKEDYQEKKKVVKGYYPQEEWQKYGVPDKR